MTRKQVVKPVVHAEVIARRDIVRTLASQLEENQNRIRQLTAELIDYQERVAAIPERYRVFHEMAGVAFLTVDLNGIIVELNATAEQMLGGKPGSRGTPFISLVSTDEVLAYHRLMYSSMNAERFVSGQLSLTVSGRTFPVRASVYRQKKPAHYLIAISDRTETAALLADRLRIERQFHSIVDSGPDVIMFLDPKGTITFANRSWLQKPVPELIGKAFVKLIPETERQAVEASLSTATRFGTIETCEIQYPDRSHQPWFEFRFGSHMETISRGVFKLQSTTLFIRDITKQKTAELSRLASVDRLRLLSARSDQIREDERGRIAREIHDELGQTLTVLKMDLAWMRSRMPEDDPARLERAVEMDASLDTMLQTVRRISSELRPPMLAEFGLVAALEWQFEQFEKRAEVHCKTRFGQTEVALGEDQAIAIFRVVQEALTNVARHSKATEVDFSLDVEDSKILVSLSDNGKGISKKDIANYASLGLSGMRERIARVGGEFAVKARRSGGTEIRFQVPKTSGPQEVDKC